MPRSTALPHLRTRRENNEIRIRNLGNLYCPDAIVMKLDVGIYEIQIALAVPRSRAIRSGSSGYAL